ncbi:hypothetical protein F0562_032477 [Nyssa sinensis]|uniref:NB-ARC domain-containing protein n=1 Tax=Nyssa sinensis TaxID=561372 RepID=A0A5J5AQ52_9ASTE|nr:hypothetical protein F0562_032477 [Nyssa sinensis]
MTDTAVDFLLENLKQLIACEEIVSELSLVQNDQINSLYEEFGFLRKFLKDVEGKRREHEEVKSLVARIGDVTYEAEETIDLFMVRFLHMQEKSMAEPEMHQAEGAADSLIVFLCMREKSIAEPEMHPKREKNAEIVKILMLDHAMKEIKSIKKEVKKIYDKKLYGTGLEVPQVRMSSHGSSSRISAPNAEEETVIGFDKEAEMIKERLLNNDVRKQLEVISIVGMPGLGKTTLARKVYNDLLIQHHFYIRGWTYVSQVPRKRDLLLSILRSVVEHKDVIYTLSYEKLGEQLYKGLSGRRYLIVIDDIWHSQIWIDLKKYFPDNRNGSRIIFTSRITDMALHEHDKSDSRHFLKFLTEDESWDLLQQKVFGKKSCSPNLVEIGKQIAVKCGGLPLAIVVVAGLLVKIDGTQDWWKQVSESVQGIGVDDEGGVSQTDAPITICRIPEVKYKEIGDSA